MVSVTPVSPHVILDRISILACERLCPRQKLHGQACEASNEAIGTPRSSAASETLPSLCWGL